MKIKVNPPQTTLAKLVCTSGPKLVILAWMVDELPRNHARGWHTHTAADNDNTQRPNRASGNRNFEVHNT